MRVLFLRVIFLAALLFAVPEITLGAPVPGVNAKNVINPAILPSATFTQVYSAAEMKKLTAAFAEYVSLVKAKNRLDVNDLPLHFATNITGQKVDLRQVFVFANTVQAALRREHKPTLLSAQAKNGVSVSSGDISIPATARVRAAPPPLMLAAPPPTPPATAAPTPEATAAASSSSLPTPKPACDPAALPNVTDAETAWKEISALATGKMGDGSSVNRCTLSLEKQLYAAEISPPLGQYVAPSSGIYEPLFGNRYASGTLADAINFSEQSGTDNLGLVSDLEANVFGTSFSALKIAATFTTPEDGNTTATLRITVGKSEIFDLTNDINPNHDFSMPGQQTIELIPPFRTNAFGATFEVDCEGQIALNGHIYSNRYGGYITAKPSLTVTITGGASSNYLIASGSLQGSLTLVTASGDIGAVAAFFPDMTAGAGVLPAFDGSPPMIAATRTFGALQYGFLQNSSLKVKLRVLGLPVVNATVPIAHGSTKSYSLPSQWNVSYILSPSPQTTNP